MADEMTSDQPILDAEEKFTVEVHNIIFDKTICCMEERFSSNKKLYCDLACLSPNNFKDLHDKEIPFDTLLELSKVLKKFDDKLTHAKLLDEMLNFSSSWDQLKRTVPEYYEKSSEDNIEEETSDKHGTNVEEVHCKSCMNCPHCCYNVLLKYNLYSNAYHFLFLAYKYLLTLPCTQVACERSFSKLKIIKTRLRNSLSEEKLEAFMLMNVEKSILHSIDSEEIIDIIKNSSDFLNKKLSY
ncbi:uncharacterized protein LOC112592371 [Melanaphis sacchari]|uniref:uncharacterized protein LOC112592371 n=1 Tax=Melanaphis sacchari TaxID=742174 RepID=UPI000DC14335|nr:uncharacterized protein LOC112592371 [Melanaphis sacchari]